MDPFTFVIAIVAIVFGSLVTLVKSGRKNRDRRDAGLNDEESRIMRDIHQSLEKMEKRVDALETIIINKK